MDRLHAGDEGERKTSRVLDFAQTLFNLQRIEGFDSRGASQFCTVNPQMPG
jgi:hypothetical protein